MLQILGINKEYHTGKFSHRALRDVSLSFRDNEFVAVLGPSGSGKTTLLNIIGGLDHYDTGDLVINGISTKRYNDRDWDSYRNHSVGFVFQSYNLIPHQTVLSNVELALTISGIGKEERRKRAADALRQVGLEDQMNKLPNQLSGGQMQRVAIARALVNNPEIVLADEPTGALDSDTSVQVMDILKQVAKNRLVVMVTHNPELAQAYATRIVRLHDGRITSDSMPYEPEISANEAVHKNMGKSGMNFPTSLALSFNNLGTKKKRTILTAFAGSIGIFGIALILSVSNGVNQYIDAQEEGMLYEYPIQVESTSVDIASLMGEGSADGEDDEDGDIRVADSIANLFSVMESNDTQSLKEYIDSGESGIENYATAIEYTYAVTPQIYRQDGDEIRQVNPDDLISSMSVTSTFSFSSVFSSMLGTTVFEELPDDATLYENQYDVVAGHWPESYDEGILVLNADGSISDLLLYTLGLRDSDELEAMVDQFEAGETVDIPEDMGTYDYEEILGETFKVVNNADYYVYDEDQEIWVDKSDNAKYLKKLVKNGEDFTIVGIVQPKEETGLLSAGLYYPHDLTLHIIEETENTEIVQQQLSDTKTNVFTGEPFGDEEETDFDIGDVFSVDEDALADAFAFDESAISDAMTDSLSDLDLSDSVDLSEIDLSEIDLSDIDVDIDTEDLLSELDIEISDEQMETLFNELMTGFQEDYLSKYTQSDLLGLVTGSTDTSKITEDFAAFLSSENGQEILQKNLEDIVEENDLEGQLTEAAESYMEEYQDEITEALAGQLSGVTDDMAEEIETAISDAMTDAFSDMGSVMASAFDIDTDAFLDALLGGVDTDDLTDILSALSLSAGNSYADNLETLGYASMDSPETINIYPKDFDSREEITEILDDYNTGMEVTGNDEKIITYTDTVGSMMSMMTDTIDIVSYALIAFVSISLVVSSIMIGVITYISVVERKKEIGILRAMGASKRNVSSIFNAETIIIGLAAGLIGVILCLIALIPLNILFHNVSGITDVSASLPPMNGIALVIISVVLTLIAGFGPSRKAAKSDPVEALRSE